MKTLPMALVAIAAFCTCLWTRPAAADATLSPRLSALEQALEAGRRRDRVLAARSSATGTPLIEPIPGEGTRVRVTFLWEARSATEDLNVSVIGPFNEDDAPASRRLMRLAGSNVWHRSYTVDRAARFTYSLAWPAGRTPEPGRDSAAGARTAWPRSCSRTRSA